jgi:hypothetical protein
MPGCAYMIVDASALASRVSLAAAASDVQSRAQLFSVQTLFWEKIMKTGKNLLRANDCYSE